MACIDRSIEDVESLIEFAKLSSSTLLNTSQTLEFSNNYNPLQNTLLQLPEKLVTVLKKGDKLVLRGEPEDFAVLCTEDETYEVREAETSNSLVLVPGLSLPSSLGSPTMDNRTLINRSVSSIHFKYLEVRPCLPRLRKLRFLLSRAPYTGPSEEEDTDQQLYTFFDLLSLVQCSDDQLRQALEELPAVHIGGHWRVLEFDYLFAVMSALLGEVQEREWPVDAVPRQQLLDAMADTQPRPVVNLCLNYYFKPCQESGEGPHSSPLVCVDDDRLCRLFAEVFLRTAGKFNLSEFLDIWQLSVPPGVSTSLSQLEGLALVDRDCSPAVVWHYPVERLPEDTAERFTELFQTRDRWSLADITPYIRELSSSKCSVNVLLAKHSRASTHNGIKYYSAKHCR